ncbi:palmitoyltransferase AKR1-like [Actinia tenebrosa]|uniref:Palmitoyltransferase n=1 Tax=Actinia tenebrosa TaxID=6105 RepID=A0A6P8J599_ACTTE|nr:palmitoyltransferase AKR1-like [Actinia tenebrosa]
MIPLTPNMALFDVISHDNVNDCKYILERDPSSVDTVGWHGMTPLHRAATRGNIEILELLLGAGADVNKENAFGETPVHYACQMASLRFLSILVDNGADMKREDKGGRGCVHHAARSGSIWKVHYLVELGLDFCKKDHRGQTVFHIAAEHGHIDLVDYCLKNKRFDPDVTDNSLMTPLHIAVQYKNRHCSWIIESSSPKTLIHLADIHGNTPLDYAAKGTTAEWLAKHLRYWQLCRCGGHKPYPWLSWLSLLISPSIVICLVAFLIQNFSQIGWVLAVFAFLLFYLFAFRSHRLRHISALPNPAFAGLFFGVILQSLLCFAFHLAPHLWYELFWNCISVFHLVIVLWTLRELFSDPGVIRSSRLNENGQPYTILDIAKGTLPVEDFCIDCEIVVPTLSKHCKLCNSCVLAIDHHCLFLMWCVGVNNHRAFILFTIEVMIAQALFIRATVSYFNRVIELSVESLSFKDVMGQEIYVSTLFIINCLGLFWVFMLTSYQIKLVSEGATTYYNPDGSPKTHISFKEMCSCGGGMTILQRARNTLWFFVGEFTFYKNKKRELSV